MSEKSTIAALLASKGKRKLTQVYVHNAQEAAACEAAGIDMIVTWERSDVKAIAAAAPNTFLTAGLVYGVYVNGDEAKRASYGLMKAGADAIYCPLSMGVVEEMTREGIPVQGHIGYIPFRKSWLGGGAGGWEVGWRGDPALRSSDGVSGSRRRCHRGRGSPGEGGS